MALLYASAGIARTARVVDTGIVEVGSEPYGLPILVAASGSAVMTSECPGTTRASVASFLVQAAPAEVTAIRLLTHGEQRRAYALAVGDAGGSTHLYSPRVRGGTDSPGLLSRPDAHLAWTHALTLPHRHAGQIAALGSLTSAAPAPEADVDRVLVTAGSDGTLAASFLTSNQLQVAHTQILKLPAAALPLALAMSPIPGTDRLLLAAGTTTKVVRLYAQQNASSGGEFVHVATLEGHDDWVRALDFGLSTSNADLLLATASQDACIRLWRFTLSLPTPEEQGGDEFESLAQRIEQDRADERGMTTKAHPFALNNLSKPTSVTARFDALLVGHDGWVQDVRWSNLGGKLLSAGVDGSAIVWSPSSPQEQEQLWLSTARLGEVGGVATGGWYGAVWVPSASPAGSEEQILTHAWNGAAHLFAHEHGRWVAFPSQLGGHQGGVRDVDWAEHGQWFLSVGHDRTTRLHAALRGNEWTQLARPQVHGYPLTGVSFYDPMGLGFVSGAEEKIVRAFEAPRGFLQLAQKLVPRAERNTTLVVSMGNTVTDPHNLKDALLTAMAALDLNTRYGPFSPLSRLTVLVISSAWDRLPDLGFNTVENFLAGVYSQAWAEAVKHNRLDVQVDVLLVPPSSRIDTLLSHPRMQGCLYACEGALSASQLEHFGATALSPLPPSNSMTESEPFRRYDAVALGGTFDHLHVGHKVLLSMAALLAQKRVVVGVTTDALLAKKKHAEQLEPLDERIQHVKEFLCIFRLPWGEVQLDIVPLADVCGPAGSEADLQALVLTEETKAGGQIIARTRAERNLPPLEDWTISVMGHAGENLKGDPAELAASKIGSTALRGWLSRSQEQKDRAEGATAAPLALSTKPSSISVSEVIDGAPSEAALSGMLWLETDKLYGHGDPLLAVECGGGYSASSASTHSAQGAQIWLHDHHNDWAPGAQLVGHALGAARVRWDLEQKRVLSVGRDRMWVLHHPKADEGEVQPLAKVDRAHTKAIRDAAWITRDEFVTVGRDKTAKIWTVAPHADYTKAGRIIRLPMPGSAVACTALSGVQYIAIGMDDGTVMIMAGSAVLFKQQVHAGAVSTLQFRPGQKELLSAGAEGGVVLLRLP